MNRNAPATAGNGAALRPCKSLTKPGVRLPRRPRRLTTPPSIPHRRQRLIQARRPWSPSPDDPDPETLTQSPPCIKSERRTRSRRTHHAAGVYHHPTRVGRARIAGENRVAVEHGWRRRSCVWPALQQQGEGVLAN
nr:unnamed protein product [Digitaria exilis]